MMTCRLPALLALFVVFFQVPVLAAPPATGVKMGTYYGAKPADYPTWFKDSFLNLKEDIAEAQKTASASC